MNEAVAYAEKGNKRRFEQTFAKAFPVIDRSDKALDDYGMEECRVEGTIMGRHIQTSIGGHPHAFRGACPRLDVVEVRDYAPTRFRHRRLAVGELTRQRKRWVLVVLGRDAPIKRPQRRRSRRSPILSRRRFLWPLCRS